MGNATPSGSARFPVQRSGDAAPGYCILPLQGTAALEFSASLPLPFELNSRYAAEGAQLA